MLAHTLQAFSTCNVWLDNHDSNSVIGILWRQMIDCKFVCNQLTLHVVEVLTNRSEGSASVEKDWKEEEWTVHEKWHESH